VKWVPTLRKEREGWGTRPSSSGQSTNQPLDTPKPPPVAPDTSTVKTYALEFPNLTKCTQLFFGPNFKFTYNNLPNIDGTSREINSPSYDRGSGYGQTDPKFVPDHGRATIFIDKHFWENYAAHYGASDPLVVTTYLHEAANARAIQQFTQYTRGTRAITGPLGRVPSYAQNHDYSRDNDIGQQFGECLTTPNWTYK